MSKRYSVEKEDQLNHSEIINYFDDLKQAEDFAENESIKTINHSFCIYDLNSFLHAQIDDKALVTCYKNGVKLGAL